MTEQQVVDLIDRVTTTLPAAGPDLVAGAVAGGRRRRRRHVIGTAAATVAVLGLVGTGLTVALSGAGADGARAVDPATPSKPQRTTSAPAPAQRWALAVNAVQVPATFASVLPGQITTLAQKDPDDANPIIDFQWNGFATRVGVTSDSYITGKSVADPQQRCQEFGIGQPCVPGLLPGSFEQSSTWTGPAVDGGATTRVVAVYFAEGWDVTVMTSNAADFKDSPALAPDVPLTLDQLRQAAYSEVWFQ
jgi:hypothetical protein